MVIKIKAILFIFLFYGSTLLGNQGKKWIDETLQELERSAEEGDSYAQGFLALCYIHGDKGLNISFDSAEYWANLSAKKNHWLGLFAMGYLNRFPPIGPDPVKVGKYYNQVFSDPDGTLVKNGSIGDPVASYVIGEIFTAEELEPQLSPDIEFAAKHYANSSNGGYGPGSVQHALLMVHANSIKSQNMEIGRDISAGINLLKQVVETHLPSAHHFLGHSYFKGIGLEKDYQMALVHFQAAADRGYSTSQLIVSHFYAYGLTGPAKIDIALRYANLALKQEGEKAAAKIAEYENLLSSTPSVNNEEIMSTPEADVPSPTNPSYSSPPPLPPSPVAANTDQGFTTTQNRLPSIYKSTASSDNIDPVPTGREIENSPLPEPVPTNSNAGTEKLELAKRYYFGRGVQGDLSQAFELFSESAQSGNAEAARYLGIMHLRGKGVQKDMKEALFWFEKAASGGDELAVKNVKTLKMLVTGN